MGKNVNANVERRECWDALCQMRSERDAALVANARLQARVSELEAALSDARRAPPVIGDATREPDDTLEWAKRPGAQALPTVRAALPGGGKQRA